jgi:hypothetical protein
MQEPQKEKNLQDLILEACPLGCNGKCSEVWINEIIAHRIMCKCTKGCHNKKGKALEVVVGSPATNAAHNDVQPSFCQERPKRR